MCLKTNKCNEASTLPCWIKLIRLVQFAFALVLTFVVLTLQKEYQKSAWKAFWHRCACTYPVIISSTFAAHIFLIHLITLLVHCSHARRLMVLTDIVVICLYAYAIITEFGYLMDMHDKTALEYYWHDVILGLAFMGILWSFLAIYFSWCFR